MGDPMLPIARKAGKGELPPRWCAYGQRVDTGIRPGVPAPRDRSFLEHVLSLDVEGRREVLKTKLLHASERKVILPFGAFISICFRDAYVLLRSKIGLSRSHFNNSARFEPACETAFQGRYLLVAHILENVSS
jgi:hypothetical protein